MFQNGDKVMYGIHGLCNVEGLVTQMIHAQAEQYYCLRPVFNQRSTVFVPLRNETAVAKMLPVISEDELRNILQLVPGSSFLWEPDRLLRKDQFAQILDAGNRLTILKMIQSIYSYRDTPTPGSKKLYAADERILKEAEKRICEEFSYVLKIAREEVLPFIISQIPTFTVTSTV